MLIVNNDGCGASLERNKIYAALPDAAAARDGHLRVIDESGEDYLFAAERFGPLGAPGSQRASLLRAS